MTRIKFASVGTLICFGLMACTSNQQKPDDQQHKLAFINPSTTLPSVQCTFGRNGEPGECVDNLGHRRKFYATCDKYPNCWVIACPEYDKDFHPIGGCAE